MSRGSRGWRVAVAVLVASSAMPAGAAAQEVLSRPEGPTTVSAFAGRLAWSELDTATGEFRLMTRSGATTQAVPVATRKVPFDVDLGPEDASGIGAVYSRCRVEPGTGDPRVRAWRGGTPQWSTGRGCDIFRFSFQTGRETRIPGASTAGASEFLPTLWRGRVAFARRYERRRGADGRRAHLYFRALEGGRASRGLPEPPRAERGKVEPGPSAMDLRGRRLALAWETHRIEPISEIDLLTLGGRRRLVDRVSSGEIQILNLTSPSLRAGILVYGHGAFGDSTSGEVRRLLDGGAHERAVVSPDRMSLWTAVGAGGIFGLLSAGAEPGCFGDVFTDGGLVVQAPCELRRFGDLAWERFKPRRFRLDSSR